MSYGDLQKSIDDLIGKKAFSTDKSFTLKSKTASGVTLKGETKIAGSGATSTVSGKFKTNSGINFTKLEGSSTGKFKVDAELADAVDGLTLTSSFVAGSDASKVTEVAELGFGYTGVSDLDLNAALDFMGAAMTLNADTCYKVSDNLVFGADVTYKFASFLPGAGEAKSTGVTSTSLGLAYKTGDFECALKVGNPGNPSDAAANVVSGSFFHKCSSDTKWGATLAQSGKGAFSARSWKAAVGAETVLASDSTATYKVDQDAVASLKLEQTLKSNIKVTFQSKIDFSNLDGDQSVGVGVEVNN
jgi:hypothetical protein